MIRAYNEATGVANSDFSGYHETIILASLQAARRWLMEQPDMQLLAACNELMISPRAIRWLLAHWSRDRLFSVEARRQWLDTDLGPFPY